MIGQETMVRHFAAGIAIRIKIEECGEGFESTASRALYAATVAANDRIVLTAGGATFTDYAPPKSRVPAWLGYAIVGAYCAFLGALGFALLMPGC